MIVGSTSGDAAADVFPPIKWSSVESQASVTGPNGIITSQCFNGKDLQTFDNQGNVIRHIPRMPQIHNVENCVEQPQVDARGDLYGILRDSDYLVGYSKTGVKWSKKLNCGNIDYAKRIVVGGNGHVYAIASANGGLHVWGISPNITPPAYRDVAAQGSL